MPGIADYYNTCFDIDNDHANYLIEKEHAHIEFITTITYSLCFYW